MYFLFLGEQTHKNQEFQLWRSFSQAKKFGQSKWGIIGIMLMLMDEMDWIGLDGMWVR